MINLLLVLFPIISIAFSQRSHFGFLEPNHGSVDEEWRSLDQLYEAALGEGGNLLVYAGGDSSAFMLPFVEKFKKRFPGINIEVVVDLSKYQNARIDNQLKQEEKEEKDVLVDVTHLQTVHDFPRWKLQGDLLKYKPKHFRHIYKKFRDNDGAYYAVSTSCFGTEVNTNILPNRKHWPKTAMDWLKPEFSHGRIILKHPNDDDAVLFMIKQIVEKYGMDWLIDLKRQNPILVYGKDLASLEVSEGRCTGTFVASCNLRAPPKSTNFFLPKTDPFAIWPEYAAIFKDAPHPHAAKLYVNFLLSNKVQLSQPSFSVREDIPLPFGYKSPFDYPNANPSKFIEFMQDRRAVETFRNQVNIVLGKGKGESLATSELLGLYPEEALIH